MDVLQGLFDKGIATAFCDPRIAVSSPFQAEEPFVERAVESRKRDFHAGRASARAAMARLGLAPVAIPAASDRAPVWPFGIVGSISHCATLCVAAVARQEDGYVSIGVDVEPAESLPEELVETICTPAEQDWLGLQPRLQRMLLARAIFSAKEAVYKCQYPLTRDMLDFQDVHIAFGDGTYRAQFLRHVAGMEEQTIPIGRFKIADGYILTSSVIKSRSSW